VSQWKSQLPSAAPASFGRKVLAWSLSHSLDTAFCLQALREVIAENGRLDIMNTDQGCQFTSIAFTEFLHDRSIRISMDRRGRALDNVFIKRLRRRVKYEEIYRREYRRPAPTEGLLGRVFSSSTTTGTRTARWASSIRRPLTPLPSLPTSPKHESACPPLPSGAPAPTSCLTH